MSAIKMNFDIDVAKLVGTDAAILLSNIEFWVAKNEANNKSFFEGRYWTYNSINAWCRLFPYLTERQIRRCLEKLEKENFIVVGNFNKKKYDRTKWYSTTRKKPIYQKDKTICPNGQMQLPKNENGIAQTVEPIPDNNTDNNNNNIDFDFNRFLEYFNEKLNKRKKFINDLEKEKIIYYLNRGYKKEDFKIAIDNISKDEFHINSKFNISTLQWILKEENFEKYYSQKPIKKQPGFTNH